MSEQSQLQGRGAFKMKLAVWHNIMWSRYKAAVFSALATTCTARQVQLKIIQIAETENDRIALSPVDHSWHQYPYELLFRGPYESILRFKLFYEIAKRAWAEDADVTILAGYDRPEYWIQAIILSLRRKRFACFCDSTIYDNPQRLIRGLLKRMFFRICSGIFCYGQRAAEYVQFYGGSPNKIIRRCQAAALYEGYSPEAALKERLELCATRGQPRYLYVGRLSKEKSIDHLLLAFDRVRKQNPNATLVLIGGGKQEADLRRLRDRLGLQDAVEFAGSKHDRELFLEYLKATCLILPSYREPWGLVVNEALSHGCPAVVSNRCGCVPELVSDGNAGFAFEWGDLEDLSAKMLAVADLDPASLAERCLTQIAPFTPESAARSIFEGSIILSGANS